MHAILKALAALTWLIGGVVLLAKGLRLSMDLRDIHSIWVWLAPLLGVAIGIPKVKFLYSRLCRRNLDRIAALENPRIWQFFRPGFFLFLAAMIALGALLSYAALNNDTALVCVVMLDFALATALLGSSAEFIRYRPAAT